MTDVDSVGRPTKYKPVYADMVTEWIADGNLMYEFADEIGVHISTIHNWKNSIPAFLEAIKLGEELTQYWAQKFVKDACHDNTIQSVPFIMYCRNFLKLKTKDDEIKVDPEEIAPLDGQPLEEFKQVMDDDC